MPKPKVTTKSTPRYARRDECELAADIAMQFARAEPSEIWRRIALDAGKVARAVSHLAHGVDPAASIRIISTIGKRYQAAVVEPADGTMALGYRFATVRLDLWRFPGRIFMLA